MAKGQYWRIDKALVIKDENIIELINVLKNNEGNVYSSLKTKIDRWSAIVTQAKTLGLYVRDLQTDKVYTSEAANLIYSNNSLVKNYLEYCCLKFQFPRPAIPSAEEISKPYLIILKLLIELHQINPDYAFVTEQEFHTLFKDSVNSFDINSINNSYAAALIAQPDRSFYKSDPVITPNSLSWDRGFFLNSDLLIENKNVEYPNAPPKGTIALNRNIDSVMFAKYLINRYSEDKFLYNTANPNLIDENNYSDYMGDLQGFYKYLNEKNMLQYLNDFKIYCNSKGFFFPDDFFQRFLTSLLTKPFLLLTGISGTGKSKIAELFGEFLRNNNYGEFKIIPVGSNWNDNRQLLGYLNPLLNPPNGQYFGTDLVDLIKKANANPTKTYICLLDEMNLSYTERYFSDFLSALETRSKEISLPDKTKIHWSENLKIIGTINEDETTHTISPKVIDRAFIMEMNGDNPSDYFKSLITRNDPKIVQLISKNWHKDFILIFDEVYIACKGKFGFRAMDEVMDYVLNNFNYSNTDFKIFMDEAVYQKILPKIHGTKGEVKDPLTNLLTVFNKHNFIKSKIKAERMIDQMNKTGFTSF
jgi:hypothetical protein